MKCPWCGNEWGDHRDRTVKLCPSCLLGRVEEAIKDGVNAAKLQKENKRLKAALLRLRPKKV
jgi:hypothetical protein